MESLCGVDLTIMALEKVNSCKRREFVYLQSVKILLYAYEL